MMFSQLLSEIDATILHESTCNTPLQQTGKVLFGEEVIPVVSDFVDIFRLDLKKWQTVFFCKVWQ